MLTRHEALLDIENDPVNFVRDGVRFASRAHLSAEVTLPIARWIDMGWPRHIKVVIEPVGPRPTFGPGDQPLFDDIAPHGA